MSLFADALQHLALLRAAMRRRRTGETVCFVERMLAAPERPGLDARLLCDGVTIPLSFDDDVPGNIIRSSDRSLTTIDSAAIVSCARCVALLPAHRAALEALPALSDQELVALAERYASETDG